MPVRDPSACRLDIALSGCAHCNTPIGATDFTASRQQPACARQRRINMKRPSPLSLFLPVMTALLVAGCTGSHVITGTVRAPLDSSRSEEHTSELQSHSDLVCRLLLEKKKRTLKRGRVR